MSNVGFPQKSYLEGDVIFVVQFRNVSEQVCVDSVFYINWMFLQRES